MNHTSARVSMTEQIRAARAADPAFDRAHRTVQGFMAAWAVIILLDRAIGILAGAYEQSQLVFALGGGALLILVAYLGTRGHIQLAMMLMEINMAVFLLQFCATCLLYRDYTMLWSTVFYGAAAGILLGNSLMLFLNRNLESYRAQLRRFSGKDQRGPLFYRTNNRLIRNKK